MKFNYDSWHYKLNKFVTDHYSVVAQDSLCNYFWFTVWNMFKALCGLAACLLIGVVLSIGLVWLFAFFLGIFTHTFFWEDSFENGGIVFLGMVMVHALYLITEDKVVPEYMNKFFNTKVKEKTPSLIKEYYKAHKEKYCPRIEWE